MTEQTLHTHRVARAIAVALVLLATALGSLGLAASAGASSACGDKVLADWFDNGRIDRLYDLQCYEDAISAIPREIRDYADAEEVIRRALQDAAGGRLPPGGVGLPRVDESGDPAGEPKALPAVDTSAPSSVPLPLLVLGGLSLTLFAAGGLGYVSRRRRAGETGDSNDENSVA